MRSVAVGGTFDHLHKGHLELINTAIKENKHLIIGLTTDALLTEKKYPELIEPFEKRKSNLIKYLEEKQQFFAYDVLSGN